jgi:hypothetical protein
VVWGEVSICGYLPHINRLFAVFALVVGWNTTDSELHATDVIVHGPDVTGACDVVSVMPQSPVLPEFRAWALARAVEARPTPCGRIPQWQETRDPGCKNAVNWVSKSIRRMTRKKALERWEQNLQTLS